MRQQKRTSTTRLPRTILEEIQKQSGEDINNVHKSTSKKSRTRGLSRKNARKQERTDQKQKKAQFFSLGRKRRAEDDESLEPPQQKRVRKEEVVKNEELQTTSTLAAARKKGQSEKADGKITEKIVQDVRKGKKGMQERSVQPLPRNRIEEEEDAYIAHLERKLGYMSGKAKRKGSLEEDDLDDLLGWADSFQLTTVDDNVGESEEGADDGSQTGGSNEDHSEEVGSREDEDGDEDEDEEWGGIESSGNGETAGEDGITEQDKLGAKMSSQVVEQSSATSVARYIPPHLKQAEETQDSEALLKLRKQLKGLFNRMSEQNLSSIIDGIEELYRNNRRHDVTSSITNLVIDGISSHSILLDSYVVLHAALISALHKLNGVEFAAYFVRNAVSSYEHHYKASQSENPQALVGPQEREHEHTGKECSNMIVLLSELYNFQVISSVLVFDLVRQLLQDDLTEFSVELLLKLLRTSGQQLRHDDPSALKDIVDIVQRKVAGKGETLSSRTRFMIEVLVNLKNNKVKRNEAKDQGGDAVERMKKYLANLFKKKHVLAHDALRVSLEDLHSAESRGKWWLVGAAWSGDPLVDAQDNITSVQVNSQTTASDSTSSLLKLARRQGMNTDIRRSIFVVLMSSDDYVDACERLSQLSLTEVQQREIVRVLLHCCGNEKTYNPYYALVCQHLCRQSHSYKVTLQFCLWDFLRDLGEVTVGGAEVVKSAREGEGGFDLKKISTARLQNTARAYAWWIAKSVANISILKAVDFTILKPRGQEFLQELMLQLFINSQTTAPLIEVSQLPATRSRAGIEEIFVKAARLQDLTMGLVYFLTNTFSVYSHKDETLVKFVTWAKDLALETLRAGMDIIPAL